MPGKDLFDFEDEIPTLQDVAKEGSQPPPPRVTVTTSFYGEDLPAFGTEEATSTPEPTVETEQTIDLEQDPPMMATISTAVSIPAEPPQESTSVQGLDLEMLETLIEPIVHSKIQKFADELSRVVVKDIINLLERELDNKD